MTAIEEQHTKAPHIDPETQAMIYYFVEAYETSKNMAAKIVERAKRMGYSPILIRDAIIAAGRVRKLSRSQIYRIMPAELKDKAMIRNNKPHKKISQSPDVMVTSDNSRTEQDDDNDDEHIVIETTAAAAVQEPEPGTALPPKIHYVIIPPHLYTDLWGYMQSHMPCKLRCQDDIVIMVMPCTEVLPK